MKIALTSVMVDDQAKAHRFYTDVLGFETSQDMPLGEHRWLTVTSPEGAHGVELLLEPLGHPASRPFQQALYESGVPATSFASRDLAAEYARLVERGVVFRSPPTEMGPVTIAMFEDGCGNLIQLHQVHGGEVAEAGAAGKSPEGTAAAGSAVETGMLIRRAPHAVFEAFVDPAITSHFWFSTGSGRLEPGRTVTWRWEMYDLSIPVTATAVEPDDRVVFDWPGQDGSHRVECTFRPHGDDATFVNIRETGFTLQGAALTGALANAREGFTLVLAGAKAWLEHDVELGLVPDRYPPGVPMS